MKFWGIAILLLLSIAFLEFPLSMSKEDYALQFRLAKISPSENSLFKNQFSLYPNASFALNPHEIVWIIVKSDSAPVLAKYLLLDNNFDSVHAWKGHPKLRSSIKLYGEGFATLSTSNLFSSLHFIPLDIIDSGSDTIYIQLKGVSWRTKHLLNVGDSKFLIQYQFGRVVNFYLLIGMGIMVVFFCVSLYTISKEKFYLFYILYIFSMLYMLASFRGLLLYPAYLKFLGTPVNYYSVPYNVHIVFLSILMLSVLTSDWMTAYRKYIYGLLVIWLCYYSFIRVTDGQSKDIPFIQVAILGVFTYWSWRQHTGLLTSIFLRASLSTQFVSHSVNLCRVVLGDSVEWPRWVNFVANLGYSTALEFLLFSWYVTERLLEEKQSKENYLLEKLQSEKELVQQLELNNTLTKQLNEELEVLVSQKTEVISQQSAQIAEYNRILELSNLKLRRKVKMEEKARALNKILSFKEFCSTYSTEELCNKYLAEVKWKNGFKCKICFNNKYSLLENTYARRCSKCSSIESVTAHTVFSNLKFPLQKAFYIVYRWYQDRKIESALLSKELEMKKSTCDRFLDKLNEKQKGRKISKDTSIWIEWALTP